MRLDPAAWTISLVGCIYDWLLTREWKKVLTGLIPTLLLLAAVAMVVRGQTLNKDRLASWYLELGEKEIEGWDKQWAPETPHVSSSDSSAPGSKESADAKSNQDSKSVKNDAHEKKDAAKQEATIHKGNSEGGASVPPKLEDKQLSPFAMALFRRVLQLQAKDQRAQWVIGMIMAQRGSVTQAYERLRRIAPDDREGYLPAHAWMAQYYMQRGDTIENLPTILHHLTAAFKGSRVPVSVLLMGGQLYSKYGQWDRAIGALQRASQVDPQCSLPLAKYARHASNLRSTVKEFAEQSQGAGSLSVGDLDRIAENAEQQAVTLFSAKLQQDPYDSQNRLRLAETYVSQRKLAAAEALLREGLMLKETPQLKRGLSEVWRLLFVVSLKTVDGQLTGDFPALENALRIDPLNPNIAQEVAQLARLGGARPPKELLEQLQQFLTSGQATAATHAWIAELHLVRGAYKESIPHLEQVINRLPDAADYLNNMAYVLAKVAPNRLEEALGFCRRATKLDASRADFHDTQGMVLMTMGKPTEALTAFEEAIRLEPNKADFHTRAAEAYAKIGDPDMAARHQKMAQTLTENAKNAPQPTIPYPADSKPGQLPENSKPVQKSAT